MVLFKKVAIVGVGLIGGSLGMAIKKKKLAESVFGVSRHIKTIDIAKRKKAIDKGSVSLSIIIKGADLIILATPVHHILKILPQVFKLAKQDTLIIDVASTKGEIIRAVVKYGKAKNFVGCHPLAGSEKRGIINAQADLFKDSLCVLVPLKNTGSMALEKAGRFWQALGARTARLSAKEHDKILALTSHLPHIAAFSLINSIPERYLKFSASGLKDTTRIASSDPQVWQDIFMSNKRELSGALNILQRNLARFKQILLKGDSNALARFLRQAKSKRDSL